MLGGFSSQEVQPGLYELSATGSYFLGSAHATWKQRAEQLCGKEQYKDIGVAEHFESTGNTMMAIKPGLFVPVGNSKSTLIGYVLCNASLMNKDEAVKYIQSLPELHKKELEDSFHKDMENLGGSDCNVPSPKDTAETYYQRGKLLMSLSQYKPAQACLLKAVTYGPAASVYRDACTALGEMFELGFGVTANITTAKEWYAKAGLL